MAQRHPSRIRLLLVEDHEILRVSLRVLINNTDDIHIIDEAGTASEALVKVMVAKPDVVLLDINLPDGDGVQVCRAIRAGCAGTRVLFLTAFCEEDTLLAAIAGGADGFIHKTAGIETLIDAIKMVAKGKSYFDEVFLATVTERMRSRSVNPTVEMTQPLSLQEKRVIVLVAEGKTNKEIAGVLGLSEKTVKNYLSHVYSKLQVTRRAQAVVAYLRSLPNEGSLRTVANGRHQGLR